MRILLVEDEALLGEAVAAHLNKRHAVDWMQSLEEASGAMKAIAYDLLLLDLNLPDGRGLDLLRSLRKAGQSIPVIIITARDQIRHRIEGLNAGADDYISKPFHVPEVAARLKALIRRTSGHATPVLTHGRLTLDTAAGRVTLDDKPVDLTARELRMLNYFMHRIGRIISQADLIEHLYTLDGSRESNTIEVYVSRLRRKLGPDVIKTVRGLGYRMD